MKKTAKFTVMTKEKEVFKKKSKHLGKSCNFCPGIAIWEVSRNGSAVLCCGSKHCRKDVSKMIK